MEVSSRGINVAIITDYNGGYSESFIKAHIDHVAKCVIYSHQLSVNADEIVPNPVTGSLAYKTRMRLKKFIYANVINPIDSFSLKKTFRKHHIDVVLAEYGHIGINTFRLLRKTDIPVVVHFHGIDAYLKTILQQREFLYKEMFGYAKGIIAVSRDMQNQLIKIGAPPEKVFYNTYGVDMNRFTSSDPSASPPHVLAAGRFVEKKAPYLTILAFCKVLDVFPEAQLTIAGDGPLLDVCVNLVKSLNLGKAVNLPGSVSQECLSSLMQKSRAFVQHSLVPASGDSEGTPNTILEAGAAGLPVVSTKHAGIKDIVQHNITGFLVEEGDIDQMAQYILKLLQEPKLAGKMGKEARYYIEKNHSLEKSINNLKAILAKVTNEYR